MKSTSTTKKILFIVIVVICLVIIKNLATSIYDLWNKQELVTGAKADLEREKKENQRLKAQLTYVKSDQFIEEEARDKLFMVKDGENSVIVPKDISQAHKPTPTPEAPSWQQWINLFLGK